MRTKYYEKVLKENKVKRPIFKNAIKAFLVGGLISIFAEGLIDLYHIVFDIEEKTSNNLMSLTIVIIAALLTGLGIFDKIGEFAGAGTIIPITGFSNSMTSSALESKSEGIIKGILTNMFKLAGAIIASGVITAFISALIIYIVRM